MNKQMFLAQLESGLAGLPPEDREERLIFYGEMIDDRMEEGLSEEEAVASAGSVGDIVSQTLSETPGSKPVGGQTAAKKRMPTWLIVVLICTAPIWFSLLIAAAAVIFSLYVTLWALVVSLWAIELSLFLSFPGSIVYAVACVMQGYPLTGVAAVGVGLICLGLAIFLFFGCLAATKGSAKLAKKIVLGIRSLFSKKEGAK